MSAGARNAAAANTRAMADFRKQLEALFGDFDESAKRVVTRMAAVGMDETVKNTPVGVYSPVVSFVVKSGKHAGRVVTFTTGIKKQGGTLKKAWIKTSTRKVGSAWISGYSNSTPYAIYVNEGHRIVVKGETVGFKEGRHMLEIGMRAAEKALPSIAAAEIARIKRKSGF